MFAIRRERGAADGDEDPRAAAVPAPPGPRSKRELRALAADWAGARRAGGRDVARGSPASGRSAGRVQARELVGIAREVVQLPLAAHVLGVEPVAACGSLRRSASRAEGRARSRAAGRARTAAASGRPGRGSAAHCVAATIVGARSMFETNWLRCCPAGMSGPADDQRHADRRLVEQHLPVGHAVLAVEEPVVRGEDDVRLVELAGRRQPVDDLPDGVVDREQRLEPLLVVLANRGDPRGAQQRPVADRRPACRRRRPR